jgi:hypothetical protein
MSLLKTATMQVVSDCTSMQDKSLEQLYTQYRIWLNENCFHLAAIVAAFAQGKYGITAWKGHDKKYKDQKQGFYSLFNKN